MLAGVLVCAGCSQSAVPSVTREEIFTFQIGRLEDEIAVYNLEGDRGVRRTNLAMRDGLFYIADGNGEKIVRYNSYGDPLFMIYNAETNPAPLSLRTLEAMPAQEVITRWAFTYPLQNPGKITVDSRKHIFVEDRLPEERHDVDEESGARLHSVVLHFDGNGQFVGYLGQRGVGGSPFPHIEGLYLSVNDEIAVVCRIPTGWNIHWFDADGMSLYLVKIRDGDIPLPEGADAVSVDAIVAAPDARALYIKADYYRDTYDVSTNTRSGNEPAGSRIWVMQVESGWYERDIEVPLYESETLENGRKTALTMFYSLLGVISGERIFLQFPEEKGYFLLIMEPASRRQYQGFIAVQPEELSFNTFNLSDEGILSALLVGKWDIKLVWWRVDKFIRPAPR
jgi:hypothetical protein